VTRPLVSVLLAAHDAERFVGAAVQSVLAQTERDLELVVVDDGSADGTSELLAAVGDPRLVVLHNDERLGLAASLNRALAEASGRYVARLDADDVALPSRLQRQLAAIGSNPALGLVGSAVLELDERDRVGRPHVMPTGAHAVRWHAHFGSPFLHPTVVFDRELLERHELRYDERFGESEDYDLWARLLDVSDGDNLDEPLVLYRVHPGQATRRRRDVQRAFQREVGLRQITATAPGLDDARAELAWRVGAGEPVAPEEAEQAAEAFLELHASFEAAHGETGMVRAATARALAGAGALRDALALRPSLALDVATARVRRRRSARSARVEAAAMLGLVRGQTPARVLPSPVRVAVVSPEPTPYRSALFDRVAARPEVELTVLYAGHTVAGRTWEIAPQHRAVTLDGVRVPGLRRLLRHEYPVTPGVFRELARTRPDAVVVSGWSTFASQAAAAWCRARRVPYVLLVESNDRDPRPTWRRVIKRLVVPPVVRGADWVLTVGTLARDSVLARGARPERIGRFANTIDVAAYAAEAERLSPRREELRGRLGAGPDDLVVLTAARLAPEKGLDVLVRAAAAAPDARVLLVFAGDGPEREALARLVQELGVRAELLGDVQPPSRLVELYAAADAFALLSYHEPWGVVVNEAAACGLPLVLSDRVGAAYDLLRDGENGYLVPAGDAARAAAALSRLAASPEYRRALGERSRDLVAGWGYEPSVEAFVTAIRAAARR
jgi:glycosyltransferase involved in cell wall biosynthesis